MIISLLSTDSNPEEIFRLFSLSNHLYCVLSLLQKTKIIYINHPGQFSNLADIIACMLYSLSNTLGLFCNGRNIIEKEANILVNWIAFSRWKYAQIERASKIVFTNHSVGIQQFKLSSW